MFRAKQMLEFFIVFTALEQISESTVSCPTGDTAGIIKDGQTCSDLITSSTKSECYNTTTENSCCASCNSVNTGIPDCSYGDSTTCFDILCPSYVGAALENCCETCYTGTTAAPTSSTTSTTSSVPSSSSSSVTSGGTGSGSSGNDEETPSTGNNAGVIAGAVIGSLSGTALLVGGVYFLARWFNKKNKVDEEKNDALPEKTDKERDPLSADKDLPIKPYNDSLFNTLTVPPKATSVLHNHDIDNNANSVNTNSETNVSKSDETYSDATEENKEVNNDNKTLAVDDKAYGDVTSAQTDNSQGVRKQSLPPLTGTKHGPPTKQDPLPPILNK